MLNQIPLHKILFLDIETVPSSPSYNDLSDLFKLLWDKKAVHLKKDSELSPEELYKQAGIYAEFGKIVCISVGYFAKERNFRVKSFYGKDEKNLLHDFCTLVNSHFNHSDHLLCAHNGKEFDFPYIARRLLINEMEIPRMLDIAGKKPWEVNHLDTMEMWKFGDYKSFVSLNLLAAVFGIPTPKDDIDGSQVGDVYWQDGDLKRIATYCSKDVLTVAQIFLKYRGESLLQEQEYLFLD